VIDDARKRELQAFLIDTRFSFSVAAVVQLRSALRQFEVRVLVTHGYKPNLIGYLACRHSRVAQLAFVHGYTWENRRVRLYEAIDRRLLRRLGRVTCVSQGTRTLLQGYGIDPARVEAIHNAVDSESAASVVAADLRAEFGLPATAAVLVAAGRLSPEKGHRYLVAALAHLAERNDLHVVLLGAGPEEAALRQQVQAAGLTQRVIFAGYRPGVLRYLAGADLVINPSETEGLPNVVLEAFAVRTPVVATDVGGVKELVIPGETGWLVPARDPAALAAGILSALEDRQRMAEFAANAYRHVATQFSFAHQAERLVGLYEELLAAGGGRR